MRRTVNAGDPGVQERLVLTGVEVPPHALVGVIVTRELLLALRTRPAHVRVLRPQIDALARRVQHHAADVPRRRDPQNRFEELRVLHQRPPGRRLYCGGRQPASHGLLAIAASRRDDDAGSRGAAGAARSARSPGRGVGIVADLYAVTHGDPGRTLL